MSWLFSQALVEEYSEANSLDGAPCALWSGTPTPQACSWLGKTTGACLLSRSGMMFKPLTDTHGEVVLMSFLEASPAKIFPQPEKAQGLMGSAAECGATWPGSLAKFDPASSSWRTPQCLLFEDLGESLETFPNWGMMQGGECWELAMSEHLIEGSESGLLPTPLKSDSAARRPSKNWQGNDLPSAVWRICGGEENPQKPPTKLHPEFVEWMMAWPIGWTGLRQSEMDKFQEWQHSHFKFLEGSSNEVA